MAEISLTVAELASLCIEGCLYAIFLALFLTSSWLLVRRALLDTSGIRSLARVSFFLGGIAIFCSITAHWLLTVYRSFDAFGNADGHNLPEAFYADFAKASFFAHNLTIIMTLLFMDIVMIYHLWIVWERNKYVIVPPFCCSCGAFASAIVYIHGYLQHGSGDSPNGFFASLHEPVMIMIILSICTNTLCCVLIAWRLWCKRVTSRTPQFGGNNIQHVAIIFVESAALYVSWTILYGGLLAVESNLRWTVLAAWSPLSGISFMLINVNAAFGLHQDSETASSYVRNVVIDIQDQQ